MFVPITIQQMEYHRGCVVIKTTNFQQKKLCALLGRGSRTQIIGHSSLYFWSFLSNSGFRWCESVWVVKCDCFLSLFTRNVTSDLQFSCVSSQDSKCHFRLTILLRFIPGCGLSQYVPFFVHCSFRYVKMLYSLCSWVCQELLGLIQLS